MMADRRAKVIGRRGLAASLLSCMAIIALSGCGPSGESTGTDHTVEDPGPAPNQSMDPAPEPALGEERRPACNDRNPWRNAYFGDLHVHTALSIDAYQQDVRTTPDDAYNFARGGPIPFHDDMVAIDRPLDFAAVTDHAEYLGDVVRCTAPDDPRYGDEVCEIVRKGGGAAFEVLENAFAAQEDGDRPERVSRALKILFESEDPRINADLCGETGELCIAATKSGWRTIIDAAERAYDRSEECSFTSFIGYEYSGVKTGSNYHRNIIFRNDKVPDWPVSYLDAPQDAMLWDLLEETCTEGVAGCEYISIPHNPNLSNGILLTPSYPEGAGLAEQRTLAALRLKAEPLMEVFQHKGQSECINGVGDVNAEDDALCNFEQVRAIGGSTTILDTDLITEDCAGGLGYGGMIDTGCVSRNDYLRGALLTGLEEQQRLGVNPLKLGVIASTDTHESTPGAVDEQSWRGHVGREATLRQRLEERTGLPYRLLGAPGGLAGVWAEENSRDALFDAMRRREAFGTSGPRIEPRFFAGWSYDADMCDRPDYLESAYRGGVPMGGDIVLPPDASAKPRFAASAARDPEGGLLQRLQIIKGWIDPDGEAHVRVIDVAGDRENGATVNLDTGEPSGSGFNHLCTVYVDESFEPSQPAYYYLRVVENPSLRWSWAQCIALPEAERPTECDNNAPKVIQERAWSSPIWYTPANDRGDLDAEKG